MGSARARTGTVAALLAALVLACLPLAVLAAPVADRSVPHGAVALGPVPGDDTGEPGTARPAQSQQRVEEQHPVHPLTEPDTGARAGRTAESSTGSDLPVATAVPARASDRAPPLAA